MCRGQAWCCCALPVAAGRAPDTAGNGSAASARPGGLSLGTLKASTYITREGASALTQKTASSENLVTRTVPAGSLELRCGAGEQPLTYATAGTRPDTWSAPRTRTGTEPNAHRWPNTTATHGGGGARPALKPLRLARWAPYMGDLRQIAGPPEPHRGPPGTKRLSRSTLP